MVDLKRKFPYAAFNPRHGINLAMRAGMMAEYWLSRRVRERGHDRPVAHFRLLSMTGRHHLLLLRECLFSYQRVAGTIPNLEILSDGSLEAGEIKMALDFWPGCLRVMTAGDIWASLAGTGIEQPLRRLANTHPLGLKLALVLAGSMDGPQLFTDADILWFRDPAPEIQNQLSGCGVAVGREDGNSVSRSLAEAFAPVLLQRPGPNTGCVWTDADLTKWPLLLEVLTQAAGNCEEEFNEQTILSILAARQGDWLPDTLCLTTFDDSNSWKQRQVWKEGYAARHYVRFMRHQFFRNAWKLRKVTTPD